MDVQPNDGFGTLLPLESLAVDIIFNAKKAKVSGEKVEIFPYLTELTPHPE